MREQQLYDGAYLVRRGSVPVEVTMTGDAKNGYNITSGRLKRVWNERLIDFPQLRLSGTLPFARKEITCSHGY